MKSDRKTLEEVYDNVVFIQKNPHRNPFPSGNHILESTPCKKIKDMTAETEIAAWMKEIQRVLIKRRQKMARSGDDSLWFDGVLTMSYKITRVGNKSSVSLKLPKTVGNKYFLKLQDAADWLIDEAKNDLTGW